ncbi:uncharacterized protein BDW70DRAFT_140409 [Aspergillus foveolatus]|uniref:uncharacterized protein n=1 Tax=Aspergillus foveolatus TaxID=210207 RepID=UPI003CCD3DE0
MRVLAELVLELSNRNIGQVKSFVVEMHEIYQDAHSRAKTHHETAMAALEEIMRTSPTAKRRLLLL